MILVSSDSEKYGKIATNNGVDFIKRSLKNSSDLSKDIDVINELYKKKYLFESDIIIWVRPCSPFRSYHECNKAIKEFNLSKASSLRSVRKYRENPFWHLVTKKDGFAEYLLKNKKQSNILNNLYFPTAEFDIFKLSSALKQKTIIPKKVVTFITKKNKVCDIDTKDDMEYAKYLYNLG